MRGERPGDREAPDAVGAELQRLRVIGFEVRCEDGRQRFLPRAAAATDGSVIAIDSPLALLDTDQLEFYRRRGVTLRSPEEPAA